MITTSPDFNVNVSPYNVVDIEKLKICFYAIQEYIDGYMKIPVTLYNDKVIVAMSTHTKNRVPSFWENIRRKFELVFGNVKDYESIDGNDIDSKIIRLVGLIEYYKNNGCKVFLYQLGIDEDNNIIFRYGVYS
jgi:hypothetical protein